MLQDGAEGEPEGVDEGELVLRLVSSLVSGAPSAGAACCSSYSAAPVRVSVGLRGLRLRVEGGPRPLVGAQSVGG